MLQRIIDELLRFAKERWYSPITLFVIILLVPIACVAVLSQIDVAALSTGDLIIIGALLLATVTIWAITTRCPRPRKGRIGFVIGITSESPEYRLRLARDFIKALEELLGNKKGEYKYDVLHLSNYHAQKILTSEDAERYLTKCCAHFMVFGRARERDIGGRTHHVLNLHGIVRHRRIPMSISERLSEEFSEIMPRGVKFPHESDLLSFEFTAEYIAIVSQYVIGIASLLSLDLDYAQSLFEITRKKLGDGPHPLPPIAKIQRRLPARLSEVYGAQSTKCYKMWINDRRIDHIDSMIRY